MHSLLLLLIPIAGYAASLSSIGLTVCGCTSCLIQPVTMDAPSPVVNYGNASAAVFDWLGAARDFLPSPVTLASSTALNCSESAAFLLNGTVLLEQYAWEQITPSLCFINVSRHGDGDFAFVAAVHSPNASLIISHPMDPVRPIADVTVIGDGLILRLSGGGADCDLPSSFSFCGATFNASSCSAGQTVYDGSCITPAGQATPPLGCYGSPLFAFPTPADVISWATTAGGQVTIIFTSMLGAATSFGVARSAGNARKRRRRRV